jgi:uncharacterized protein YndB with AHSA1/START domain
MAKPKDISLSLVRTIKAAPEKVFAAWTKPQTLKRWMAPSDDMKIAVAETDLRIGGRYRIVMREADGTEHRVGGAYREIDPGRKLAFTWAWESTPERETLVTVELRKNGAGTELTLTHTKFADEQSRHMHNQGWVGCIGRLERLMSA